jgi:hypothetical protein
LAALARYWLGCAAAKMGLRDALQAGKTAPSFVGVALVH